MTQHHHKSVKHRSQRAFLYCQAAHFENYLRCQDPFSSEFKCPKDLLKNYLDIDSLKELDDQKNIKKIDRYEELVKNYHKWVFEGFPPA